MCVDCRRRGFGGYCSTDPSDSVPSTTPRATRNLSFLVIRRFELILLTTAISPAANGRIYNVIPVFEQAKPRVFLIAAVSLICMILNIVNH